MQRWGLSRANDFLESMMSKMRVNRIEICDANIFETLLDNFPDMIHSVNDEGKIVYTNKTAESLLGYSREEFLSMDIRQLYADSVLQYVDEGFSDLKKHGDKVIPESLLKAKDGTQIPVEIRSFSIYDDNNIFVRTFSILRDLREMKELQQNLIHAGRLAAIGELASGVAHDINNPLSIISIANEMALDELKDFDKISSETLNLIHSQMKSVEKASSSIKKLVYHLRNFSRRNVEELKVIDLHKTLDDALFIVSSKTKKLDIKVKNEVSKNQFFFTGSQNHMEQVFVNLLANACDAMNGQAERELNITVSRCNRNNNKYWKCDIIDTGTGISENIIDEIFQSFITTKKKGEGTGLGLSIERSIILDHSGDIEVTSKKSKGTTFSVYIPQATK